jgi:hypothetical protein
MKSGYGRTQHKGRQVLTHRLAFCQSRGVEPEAIKGLVIRHKCDNPPCINPDHLEAGTVADNMADMTARGRRVKGESVGNSKLTEQQIAEIKAKYQPYSKDANQYQLSKQYGVTQSEISMIVCGARWAHTQGGVK